MWLMSYMTKNSIAPPNAVKGDVQGNDGSSVVSSGEHKNVVLPLDDGEVSIGVLAAAENLSEGEVMLRSSGGASIVLKNDGTVLINGRVIE